MDSAGSIYNASKAPYKAKWATLSNGKRVLQFSNASGTVFQEIDGTAGVVRKAGAVYTVRTRATIAAVNADAASLGMAALPGWKYRLVDAFVIAIGGAAAGLTTLDIRATLSGSARKLVAFGQAALTQSALVRAGSSGGVLLADGASFTANDVNTAVVADVTGSDATTATHFDFTVTYELVRG